MNTYLQIIHGCLATKDPIRVLWIAIVTIHYVNQLVDVPCIFRIFDVATIVVAIENNISEGKLFLFFFVEVRSSIFFQPSNSPLMMLDLFKSQKRILIICQATTRVRNRLNNTHIHTDYGKNLPQSFHVLRRFW